MLGSLRYDLGFDRYIGDGIGVGKGWPQYELDEIELGGRAAMAIDDPEQWWWEIHSVEIREHLKKTDPERYHAVFETGDR